jgi:NAD(P)-dependent dehydrogenase (short-subunit alcohol dehydrogenase family)
MAGVALCTGAASGIGRATAVALARRGASVVACDVDTAGGKETVKFLEAVGVEAEFVRADIAEPGEVDALVAAAVERFGRIDAAVNVAGTHAGLGELTADVSEEDFDTQIRVNLRGTWLCVRAELRQMAEQGSGSIVNVSSVNGLTAASRGVGYSIAKHGILGLTRTAAVEYAERGIRVNALCPGLVDTPLTARALEIGGADPEAALESVLSEIPLGRMATSEEIGECAAWLCLDAAPYLTGATITVDGGFTVRG